MHKRNVPPAVRAWVIDRQNNQCFSCKDLLETTCQVDHIDPLWHGGTNSATNLQALCPNCHARKTFVENSSIPRPLQNGNKKCPLCHLVFSPKFFHRCPKFEVVDPSTFKLYATAKKTQNRFRKFMFDSAARSTCSDDQ